MINNSSHVIIISKSCSEKTLREEEHSVFVVACLSVECDCESVTIFSCGRLFISVCPGAHSICKAMNVEKGSWLLEVIQSEED